MSERFTKSMARNIYYGGSLFFILVFAAMVFKTHKEWPKLDNRNAITEEVSKGKLLWEENNCVGCHSLLGEGAYFAPELGNVVERFGSRAAVEAFIMTRPVNGIPNRRSMPQFNFSQEELKAISAFLEYTGGINTDNWPPNKQG